MKSFSIDATEEPEKQNVPYIGRLINHGDRHECNSKMKVVLFNETPHLCLFSIKDIQGGTEILYDYGVGNLPWIIQVCSAN